VTENFKKIPEAENIHGSRNGVSTAGLTTLVSLTHSRRGSLGFSRSPEETESSGGLPGFPKKQLRYKKYIATIAAKSPTRDSLIKANPNSADQK